MQNLILGGVITGIFKIQGCYVPQKSIFDLFGKKLPARMVTVNVIIYKDCQNGINWNKSNWFNQCEIYVMDISSVFNTYFQLYFFNFQRNFENKLILIQRFLLYFDFGNFLRMERCKICILMHMIRIIFLRWTRMILKADYKTLFTSLPIRASFRVNF